MSTQVDIPGYTVGTWAIDAARSAVSFRIRQGGLATVRGTFDDVGGTIVTAPDPSHSSVRAVIGTASVNTRNKRRDEHLRTKDFLDVERHPSITFTSTGVRAAGDDILLDGDLTVQGVTKRVTLSLHLDGFSAGPDGAALARFSGRTELNRKDYGVTCGPASPFISKKLKIRLEIEAAKQD